MPERSMETGPVEDSTETGTEASASKSYHHGDLRAALIAAGLAILAENGAQALTVRAAARRAGVSHNAPYRHFASKEALLAAIAQEGFDELAISLERARDAAAPTARARLEETGWAYVSYALAHPDHLRVMFGGLVPEINAYPDLEAASTRAFNVLVEVLQEGQARGEMASGEPGQLALTAWALVHGLALLLVDHQMPAHNALERERLARAILRQIMDGLARHAEST